MSEVSERGEVRDRAVEFSDRQGRSFWLLVSAACFTLEGRDYLVLNGRDVTVIERERLEHEAILQNASMGIAMTRDRVFQLANPKFAQMFGWDGHSLVGQPGAVVWPSDEAYAALSSEVGEALARGDSIDVERVMARRDGSTFVCRLLARAVDPTHPSKGATIWIADDVTERRAVEQALAQARDDAEAANRAKSTFLANVVRAVDGVSFEVYPGEVLGLVGELGCGKSVTSLSIIRLISKPGRIEAGEILLDGENLLTMPENDMMKVRGNRISMIFQQPQTALNPVFRVGEQIGEVLNIHQDFGKEAAQKRTYELLKQVGIPDPEKREEAFPHELSGGMAQRVMIAMALACVPDLLIADEPTTALDVTIQAQILDLMRNLRSQLGSAVILITHDLRVIAEMADRVAVMYAGQIVEQSSVRTLFKEPLHPYTQGLIGSTPVLGRVRDKLPFRKGGLGGFESYFLGKFRMPDARTTKP